MNILKALGQTLSRPFLFLFNFLVATPVFLGGVWLIKQMDDTPYLTVFVWVLRLILLLLFVGIYYVSTNMARHIFEEDRLFFEAFKISWIELWFSLAWLPVVGHFFERERDPRKEFEDEREEDGERHKNE